MWNPGRHFQRKCHWGCLRLSCQAPVHFLSMASTYWRWPIYSIWLPSIKVHIWYWLIWTLSSDQNSMVMNLWDVVQKGVQQVELELRLLEALAIYRPSKLAGTPYLLLLPFLRMEFNSKDSLLNPPHSPNLTRIRHFLIGWHLFGLENKIWR